MKFFLCPDKFKGSATSHQVIDAIKKGIKQHAPQALIHSCPISDGGEGFAQIASQHMEGHWIEMDSKDALLRPIKTRYFLAAETAYIDMSATNGLVQIAPGDRDPMQSSTYGTGLMIKHATQVAQANQIFVGLGGSATNDGGAGMAAALGARFFDTAGNHLTPTPHNLMHCDQIDLTHRIALPPIIAACDVTNTLLGENGATRIYGPQKGVSNPEDFEALLTHLMLIGKGEQAALVEGSGAAGGIAYGLLHYAQAALRSGFDIVSEITQLEKHIAEADIVITGEGSLDEQTLNGKGPQGVAKLAKKHDKPVFAIAGNIDHCARGEFDACFALNELGLPLETCLNQAEDLITRLAQKMASNLSAGKLP